MKTLIITLLLVTGMVNAQIVNIPDPNFKAALINAGVDTNFDGNIQVTEALNTTGININAEPLIASIEGIGSFTNITSLLLTNLPQLTSIDLSGLTNLVGISFDNLPLVTSLNLTGCTSLVNFGINSEMPNITSINLSGFTNLETFIIHSSPYLGTPMNLTSLNLSGCTGLKTLGVNHTTLESIDVSDCIALEHITCGDNLILNLDFSGLTNLLTVDVGANVDSDVLLSLNVNGCTALNSIQAWYNVFLESIYMKNGRNESVNFSSCYGLAYICADDSQVAAIQTQLNNASLTSTVCNSYCSFTPGGNHNTITGSLTFDANNDGCDASDVTQPHIRVNLGNPIIGSTFTNTAGNYTFYTGAGSFDWLPDMENPGWFTISPNPGTVLFPDNNNNTVTQNFCITANGSHPDLEVVIAPIGNARPGFDASYKIVFRNKGNQTLSGNVELNFDDSRLDFLSALPAATTLATNSLNWAYSNLMPFESRAITIVFEVNTPEETPAVNIDDVLDFQTSITPVAGDELPSDNTFTFHQTVVGSMDPNDIICLEGNVVPPSEIGNYLHYVIRFENTGNYYAENVVVKDIIDTNKYDINSLQLLNTSHPSYTRITGNVVEFIFENINLPAAAGTPPVGGHGDVLFKIKSKNTLVDGDSVLKSGKIYFDYNAPITTNNAVTIYQTLSNGIPHLDNSITIYPNPANSILNIECNSVINTIELYDIQGRLLETEITEKNKVVFDISSKQNGIYFLKITSEKGSKVEKIVKE
jgi:hypothetical protein